MVGATYNIALNVREVDVRQTVMELTHGIGADMVVECTGQPGPAAEALDIVRKNGRISYNGIYHEPVTLQLDKIVQWNLLITGPKAEGMLNLSRAIPLMADGRINLINPRRSLAILESRAATTSQTIATVKINSIFSSVLAHQPAGHLQRSWLTNRLSAWSGAGSAAA